MSKGPKVCRKAAKTLVALAMAAPWAASNTAHAQRLLDQYLALDLPGTAVAPGVTVTSRLRPEYDPVGIRYGEVTVRPELFEALGGDDNVLGQHSHRGSALVETNARVLVNYDHSDTTAFTTLNVDDNHYPEQNQQSYTNWTAALGGSHQFGRDALAVSYNHLNLNQTVRDLDTPNLNNALPYQVDVLRADYRAVFNRLSIDPSIGLSNYNFTNGTVGNTPYIQTDRDRVVVEPAVTFGYELAPRRNVVVVLRDASASYRNRLPGEATRNFNDLSVLTGLDFDEGIFRYRLLVGYEARMFTSAALQTIQVPVAEATVIWNPTALTTVTTAVTRRIQDSANESTVGFTETAASFRVDHEYAPNILLNANALYLRDDYNQNQGQQDLLSLGVGATWLLNRNLRLVGSYEFDRRNSSDFGNLGAVNGQPFGSGYSENRVLLTFHFAL